VDMDRNRVDKVIVARMGSGMAAAVERNRERSS